MAIDNGEMVFDVWRQFLGVPILDVIQKVKHDAKLASYLQ